MNFTQYLMPDGRQVPVTIDRPPHIEAVAARLQESGCRFEIEMLSTGEISLEVVRGDRDEPEMAVNEICPNGPDVPIMVDKIVIDAAKELKLL